MTPSDLAQVWRSTHNQPSAAQLEMDRLRFLADLRRRHQGFVLFMALVFIGLAIPTGQLLLQLLWPNPSMDSVNFTREWAVIPFLAMPWVAWFYFVRQYRGHRARHSAPDASIRTGLQALLDENRMTRAQSVLVGSLQVGLLLILPVVVGQLKAEGKAGNEIDVMFVGVPGVFLVILLSMAWHYWRKLLPRKRELEALLASYESDSRPGHGSASRFSPGAP